ncbi:MAG: hypothetical protein MUP61_06300, partial [Burkholderiales bacterium]|nr:hypothetical protein [Burkholderiales bacterium]
MSDRSSNFRDRPEGVTIPAMWLAFAASLLLHLAVLWQWLPRLHLLSPDETRPGVATSTLLVRLAPPPSPPPAAKAPAQLPAPVPRARPPIVAARPRPAPPVIALKRPAPEVPLPPPIVPKPAETAPPRAPAMGDLASYIEARRRARGQPAPGASAENTAIVKPVEDDKARSDRIVAENLGTPRAQTFGYDPKQGGGLFQIRRMGYDYAEFYFFGWNEDVRRNTKQLIEVRRGDNRDLRIAVVRRMISIIRE